MLAPGVSRTEGRLTYPDKRLEIFFASSKSCVRLEHEIELEHSCYDPIRDHLCKQLDRPIRAAVTDKGAHTEGPVLKKASQAF